MSSPSPTLLLAAAGAVIALAGVVLLLVLALAGPGGAAERADGHAGESPTAAPSGAGPSGSLLSDVAEKPGGGSADGSPPTGGPALVLGPDGEPVPYWKAKQDQARRAAREQAPDPDADEQAAEPSDQVSGPALMRAAGSETPPASTATLPPTTSTTEVPRVATTRAVAAGGNTPLEGVWGGTARQLADYLLAANPSPKFSVPALRLAEHYVRYAAEVSLRADILWAQMIHETGYGKYGGSVSPEQNNYAGIGATGGPVPGHTFATAEEGVKGHVAHLAAYVYTTNRASWTNTQVDPRYDMVQPRGIARVIGDLDGRWAVPGVGYGERIEQHVRALNP